MKRKTKFIIGGVIAVAAAIGLSVGIYFLVQTTDNRDTNTLVPPNPMEPLPPSDSLMGVYWDAAVTTNGIPCAKIGRDVLMKGGNAVEAAIAALFCEGVACLQSMGLGGGFLMTIYIKQENKSITLNARETAPGAAHADMFEGDSDASQFGGLAVAVPGELKGYYAAFERYPSGNVTWAELVQPTIDLCIEGNIVTPYLGRVLRNNEETILKNPSLVDILIDPATGHVWAEGQRIKRLQLAESLRVIQLQGSDALYSTDGDLLADFVKDVQDFGGIITEKDMTDYQVRWEEPIIARFGDGMSMYTVPPPGSGILVAFILNILDGFISSTADVVFYQRIIESFKFGFGKRTELGDPHFDGVNGTMAELISNLTSPEYAAGIRSQIRDDWTSQDAEYYGAVLTQPDDHGTAHISVLAPNGDAVSVTSTVNLILGAMIRSRKTGIILNDEMDDFAAPNITNGFDIPPSPANVIVPGKRPLSSMCPAIFVDKHGDVQLVVGAAGGTKITTATILVAIHNLWRNTTIKEALDANRIHHQLFPMNYQYEYGMPHYLVDALSDIGHNMTRYSNSSSVTAIARSGNMIHANSDFRRGGITAGF